MLQKKSLGQNFLKCDWAVKTMINASEVGSDDLALEIGPGTGVLTRELARNARRVIAVEKDDALAAELADTLKKEKILNVSVINADILDLYKNQLAASGLDGRKYKVVSNIPYYLTSRLLRVMLETGPRPETAVLMLQKEVAERICAKPRKINLLALSVQAFGSPEIIKKVPADCFSPKPRVDSAIIKIEKISDAFFRENAVEEDMFFRIVKSAFSKKRKQLVNSLSGFGNKKKISDVLRRAGLDGRARPEELVLSDWSRIIKLI